MIGYYILYILYIFLLYTKLIEFKTIYFISGIKINFIQNILKKLFPPSRSPRQKSRLVRPSHASLPQRVSCAYGAVAYGSLSFA